MIEMADGCGCSVENAFWQGWLSITVAKTSQHNSGSKYSDQIKNSCITAVTSSSQRQRKKFAYKYCKICIQSWHYI
jgi:hypothetical protein